MYITLAILVGFLSIIDQTQGAVNLARGKTASQSSTSDNKYAANKAVNGKYNDFTHTAQTGIKWWRVDLGDMHSIAQIKLFNRRGCCRDRLAKITILTSTVDLPGDPSLSSADWTTRNYREEAYPLVANIDFKPAFLALHVAVYSENDAVKADGTADSALSLAEVEVYAPDNLAYNKPAAQIGTVMDASNAVNGIYTDFSQTQTDGIKWWMVDLQVKYSIGRIELYNTASVYDSTALLSILTSNAKTPENPSLTSVQWKVRSSQGGIIEFTSTTEGRHVAVFSDRAGVALTLTEVVVYEYNYASIKTSTQSTDQGSLHAELAVDRNLTTTTRTMSEPNPWWKVDLGQRILLSSVNVYVRNGKCSNGAIECSIRLSNVYFLTNKDNTNAVPTQNTDGWTTCYQNSTSLGDSYVVQCTSNLSPLTRQLAIRSTDTTRVELREVEVHGHELAQLGEDLDGKAESSTYTSITVSFIQWNQLMIGLKPPVEYVVEVVDTSSSDIINHVPTSDRVQVTFNGVNPGQEYTISVRCRLDDVEFCPGDTYTFLASTTPCTDPATPKLNYNTTEVTHNQRQMYQYTYSWNEVTANCIGAVTYRYSIEDGMEQSNTSQSVTFYIDGYETYEFTLVSENTAGLTSTVNKSGQSPKLAPQFGNSQFTIIGTSSICVELSWETPEFPGGPEQMYQYKCVGEEWIDAGTNKTAKSCGHQVSTNITCALVALNGELRSDEQTATGMTLAMDTTSTSDPTSPPDPTSPSHPTSPSDPTSTSDPTSPSDPISPSDPTSSAYVGAIVGPIVAVLAALLVMLGAVFFVRRRRQQQSAKSSSSNAQSMHDLSEIPPEVKPRPADVQEYETVVNENTYGNAGSAPSTQSEAIPVSRLGWYNRTNVAAIRKQYDILEKLPKPDMSTALLPENKGKCRYKTLYPSNEYRVKLKQSNPKETDFINASYMRGYSRDNQFIAAQGPFTDAVVNDFWLMIWQQRPSAIVMVTKATESTKMKCLQYWPEELGVVSTFGEFQVSLKSTEVWSDFSNNNLLVRKGDETRVIPHFHYIGWPDHGVPDLEVFASFHKQIKSNTSRNISQPLLIHCSAGVGRTGTYIALNYLQDQARSEQVVDVFECLKEMRSRRPCMIQTVEQYEFLHRVLYESLSTSTFTCTSPELVAKLNGYLRQTNTEADIISAEFKHILERIQSLPLSYTTARDPGNRKKNRFCEILPCDQHMPYLTQGARGNYINAVFVDGYRAKRQWIATQLPLSQTICDFWQLQLEQDVKIILQLETSQTPFYPMADAMDQVVGPFLIKRNLSSDSEHMKTITLEVESEDKKELIRVLVLKNWAADSLPTSSIIIALHLAVEKLQQQTSSGKVCVTCMDGSTRSGLYICAHNAIEKLKAEQDVDVYYPTVMAKLRRPQFVPTIEQYVHLYQMINDYVGEFSEYANFQ